MEFCFKVAAGESAGTCLSSSRNYTRINITEKINIVKLKIRLDVRLRQDSSAGRGEPRPYKSVEKRSEVRRLAGAFGATNAMEFVVLFAWRFVYTRPARLFELGVKEDGCRTRRGENVGTDRREDDGGGQPELCACLWIGGETRAAPGMQVGSRFRDGAACLQGE